MDEHKDHADEGDGDGQQQAHEEKVLVVLDLLPSPIARFVLALRVRQGCRETERIDGWPAAAEAKKKKRKKEENEKE